jgi:hypothetical protein
MKNKKKPTGKAMIPATILRAKDLQREIDIKAGTVEYCGNFDLHSSSIEPPANSEEDDENVNPSNDATEFIDDAGDDDGLEIDAEIAADLDDAPLVSGYRKSRLIC